MSRAVPMPWWVPCCCRPADPSCQLGVIFFNNVGYLGMCGHGTIGLCATLAQLNRLPLGQVRIETTVGVVSAHLHSVSEVTVRNVASYRFRKDVFLHVSGLGDLHGDVAYGGNWFFFVKGYSGVALTVNNLDELTSITWRIRPSFASQRSYRSQRRGD